MSNPYNDAVVVTALIANYQVGSILIDMGSLVNIIINFVFEKLGLVNFKLVLLYCFSGERR